VTRQNRDRRGRRERAATIDATIPAPRIPHTTAHSHRLKLGPTTSFSHLAVRSFTPTTPSATAEDAFR
jgi:hypothetical protein